MRDTCERVARITKELRALSTQFHWSSFETSSLSDQTQLLDGLLNGSLVEDLRATVDYLSQFLWHYIDFAAADPGLDAAAYELQNERLLRITEILRLLHRSSCPAQDPLAFVDRITRSVDRHLQMAKEEELLCESRAGDARDCAAQGPRLVKNSARSVSTRRLLSSWR